MELCRLAAFFEGGVPLSELKAMDVYEVIEVIKCAEKLNREQQRAAKKASRGHGK